MMMRGADKRREKNPWDFSVKIRVGGSFDGD